MRAGLVLLDKPSGMTSAGALAAAKRRLRCAKIGHAGTLDPMATGLLICLTGRATRLAQFAAAGEKEYSGRFLLGVSTDTDDIEGREIRRSDEIPDFPALERAVAAFTGEIEQVPPQVSAIKVNGVRGYERARRGEETCYERRRVHVKELRLSELDGREVGFCVRCSKGTYIRALARDLGAALGCGACVAELRREASHPFRVEQASPLEQLGGEAVRDWWELFPAAPRVLLGAERARRLQSGDERTLLALAGELGEAPQVIYGDEATGEWLGLLVRAAGTWRFGVNVA